jgi:hypothetical protein
MKERNKGRKERKGRNERTNEGRKKRRKGRQEGGQALYLAVKFVRDISPCRTLWSVHSERIRAKTSVFGTCEPTAVSDWCTKKICHFCVFLDCFHCGFESIGFLRGKRKNKEGRGGTGKKGERVRG